MPRTRRATKARTASTTESISASAGTSAAAAVAVAMAMATPEPAVPAARPYRTGHRGKAPTKRSVHECPHCDARFTRTNDRKRHIQLQHCEDAPFRCPACPTFREVRRDQQRRHLRDHPTCYQAALQDAEFAREMDQLYGAHDEDWRVVCCPPRESLAAAAAAAASQPATPPPAKKAPRAASRGRSNARAPVLTSPPPTPAVFPVRAPTPARGLVIPSPPDSPLSSDFESEFDSDAEHDEDEVSEYVNDDEDDDESSNGRYDRQYGRQQYDHSDDEDDEDEPMDDDDMESVSPSHRSTATATTAPAPNHQLMSPQMTPNVGHGVEEWPRTRSRSVEEFLLTATELPEPMLDYPLPFPAAPAGPWGHEVVPPVAMAADAHMPLPPPPPPAMPAWTAAPNHHHHSQRHHEDDQMEVWPTQDHLLATQMTHLHLDDVDMHDVHAPTTTTSTTGPAPAVQHASRPPSVTSVKTKKPFKTFMSKVKRGFSLSYLGQLKEYLVPNRDSFCFNSTAMEIGHATKPDTLLPGISVQVADPMLVPRACPSSPVFPFEKLGDTAATISSADFHASVARRHGRRATTLPEFKSNAAWPY
ncbi:hypothetical protein GGF32_001278 [Allomyces javanicus]|nr:hypothetical protein GGF32_001278 [Allomyces javanicus]